MKGKKADTEFISIFMENCLVKGINSSSEMVSSAKARMEEIDTELRKIDDLKKERSGLVDVVFSLEKNPRAATPVIDAQIARKLCRGALDGTAKVSYLAPVELLDFKRLVLSSVLSREGDNIVPGTGFKRFLQFADISVS